MKQRKTRGILYKNYCAMGYNQKEFAEAAGVSYQRLSAVMNHRIMPGKEFVRKCANTLGEEFDTLWLNVVHEYDEAQSGGDITSHNTRRQRGSPADLAK